MTKRRIYLAQVNNLFGRHAFLPYSAGAIQAYAQADKSLSENYSFAPLMFMREKICAVVERLHDVDVVGLSCYVWNWEYNKALGEAVKEEFPDALVVMGGPQVPLRSRGFFRRHPYVDVLVHNEGERAFASILRERLRDRPDYSGIPGLSLPVEGNGDHEPRPEVKNDDLGSLPSPYLAGTFDHLLDLPFAWSASQETNRGCPYSCAFCDWGSAVFSKVRLFAEERVRAEIDWFGRNHIEVVYGCDANYGMLGRDFGFARELAAARRRHGFPQQFRVAYAKKSNARVFEISQELHAAGLARGVTLSLQSLDDECLTKIGRRNISIQDFRGLVQKYRHQGIATYTELILGLPGETYDSFGDGIEAVLAAGQHEGLLIYPCEVLPNSQLSYPAYRELHGIRTTRMPSPLSYAAKGSDGIPEYFDVVIETATMSHEDWRRGWMLSWVVQCFHCLNLTQSLAVLLRDRFGLSYRIFYEELLVFFSSHPGSLCGDAYARAVDGLIRGLRGGEMGEQVVGCGETAWHPEEAAFLRLVQQKERLYAELREFLGSVIAKRSIDMPRALLNDVVEYQSASLVEPGSPIRRTIQLGYNLAEVLQGSYYGDHLELTMGRFAVTLHAVRPYSENLADYATEAVRYGRKDNHLRRIVGLSTPDGLTEARSG